MKIEKTIQTLLRQLCDSMQQLTNEEYSSPVSILSNATIGQHVRHVVELIMKPGTGNTWTLKKIKFLRKK
ncbi:MAG: hypothetical protein ABI691_06005 [Ginsengibacter sp.]